jgi:hypothetical protein
MCPDCLEKELHAPTYTERIEKEKEENFETVTNEITSDHRPTELEHSATNKLGSQSISRSEEFFNARVKPMNDRWLEIVADESINAENKHYQFAREIREHYLHMKRILGEAIEVQLQCASEMRADQVFLNQLSSKLREEERVKLHLQNIDYTPPSVIKTPKKIKVSKDDQIAASYAKIMNIPIETAKRLLAAQEMKVTGIKCTCKETPGICKVHVK